MAWHYIAPDDMTGKAKTQASNESAHLPCSPFGTNLFLDMRLPDRDT